MNTEVLKKHIRGRIKALTEVTPVNELDRKWLQGRVGGMEEILTFIEEHGNNETKTSS